MKYVFLLGSLLAASQAIHLRTREIQLFSQIKNEILQGERNAKQGNLGRQLGVSKVLEIKVHMG